MDGQMLLDPMTPVTRPEGCFDSPEADPDLLIDLGADMDLSTLSITSCGWQPVALHLGHLS